MYFKTKFPILSVTISIQMLQTHTSLYESHVTLVNQSLYSRVEIRGTKSLED